MTTFVNAVNAEDNSHLINVPSGVLPSDAIISSPILMTQHGFGRGASGNSAFGGDGNFEEFDVVDPSLDPDVAMAIRASLEEACPRALRELQSGASEPCSYRSLRVLLEHMRLAQVRSARPMTQHRWLPLFALGGQGLQIQTI